MPCEMCGKEVPHLRRVQIGGTVLEVCSECARFGDDGPRPAPSSDPAVTGPAAAPPMPRSFTPASERRPKDALTRGETELAEDYPRRISQARTKMGLTQEDLAKQLNEKKSVISHLESGEMRPSEKLIKKLERTLNIKLKERMEFQVEESKKRITSSGVTLGDIIRMDK